MTHHPTPGDREFADHLQQLADRVRAGDYEGIEYTTGPRQAPNGSVWTETVITVRLEPAPPALVAGMAARGIPAQPSALAET
jgi:hypothetical protein